MVNPIITILTVNYNTSVFIELMLYALVNLTNNQYRVIICDNGSNKDDVDKLRKIVRAYKNVEVIFRKQSHAGSIGHAEALDILIGMAGTKYAVVLDSDCTFLLKNWDEIMMSQLNDKNKIIGTSVSVSSSGLKPPDFPLPFAVMFDAETYKGLGISCMPEDIQAGKDSCWEWKSKFQDNGYEGKIFEARSTRDFKKGAFKNIICIEYYMDNELIASHFGRGSSGGLAKYYDKWFFQIPVVSRSVRELTARKQKKNWINTCYAIIKKQEGSRL